MLKLPAFHVLMALAGEDLHGSGIARDVRGQTEGRVRLWPATLYRTLDELVEARLIRELAGAEHPDGESARRRYYRITPAGRDALAEEAARMAAWARTAHQRLGSV